MSVLDLMTPEQRKRAKEPMAMTQRQLFRHQMGDHPQRLTEHFHQALGLPVAESPMIPPVSVRLRRAQLLLEEVLETLKAMGLELVLTNPSRAQFRRGDPDMLTILDDDSIGVRHIEGSRYDVVETADGLSDINVIVAGTAAEFGIPLHVTDYEVYSSNLTKVRPDGTRIVNGVTEGYREGEPGFQPNRPVGKILKPDNFVSANIPAALVAFEKEEF